ncbi:meso-butanediol dehydrogenase/(S,S)-butanediol dehydrogenase/diacetyl reductase [Neorhizobium galegae]|uniref:SDR family NAD(P)-dependent oxidoreductase n=1 Tax=Neorhizobium galegae TaxID=399 RepID=UPI001AE4C8FD|nr:SDR family oxidoreductase [Neorhizobium galegae]MBP2551453.1 meso-butanediol dehydrogenase/(S,S)-butanediol dehydrogenase/diacetyl reductase [Neorhizobium galegae]
MEKILKGKVALVTGSGRPGGLGQGIARHLADAGACVMLHDRGSLSGDIAPSHGIGTSSDLQAMAEEIRSQTGTEIATVTGDLMDEAAIENMVAATVERFGRLDILVNNAGIGYLFGPTTEIDASHLDAVLGVNLRAAILATKHAARQMIVQGQGGRIINIASQAGKSGFALATAYTASKHGMIGLTRSTAIEFGPHGITVNAICPNHVTTGLGSWQNDFMSSARGQTKDQYLAEMRARIPLGRTGTPDDIAKAAVFLCSPAADYITAEAMNVSGGEEYH